MKTASSKWFLVIVIIFSIIQILSCFKILNANNSSEITTTIERMKRSQPKSHYKVKCHQSGTGKMK